MSLPLVLLDDLGVAPGAERDGRQRLGLAPGEQRRAVDARQESGLGLQRPDLVERPVVEALALFHHDLAEGLVLEFVDDPADLGAALVVLRKSVDETVDDRLHGVASLELARGVQGGREVVPDGVLDFGPELGGKGLGGLPLGLVQVHFAEQLPLRAHDLLKFPMSGKDAVEHDALVELVRAGLDHRHRVLGTHDDQVQVGDVALGAGRVEHDFVVDQADPDRSDRVVEGDVREHESRRCAVDGEDVGVVLLVGRQHETDDLGLVEVARREQRPQGPVGQAAGDDLLLGGPSLALEEAARNPACRGGVLAIVDGEGQEAAGRAVGRHAGGGQHDRLAELHGAGTVRLSGQAPRLESHGAVPDRNVLGEFHGVV